MKTKEELEEDIKEHEDMLKVLKNQYSNLLSNRRRYYAELLLSFLENNQIKYQTEFHTSVDFIYLKVFTDEYESIDEWLKLNGFQYEVFSQKSYYEIHITNNIDCNQLTAEFDMLCREIKFKKVWKNALQTGE